MAVKRQHALIYKKVPPFLKEMRERAGLTQRELASAIGQTQWWVHRSEIGSRRIDVAEFLEWCAGCEVAPDRAVVALAKLK
jgi:transcriptional regulator with XRE-family HTH domain